MTQCALVAKTCQIEHTLSAPLRSIRGWRFGREVHLRICAAIIGRKSPLFDPSRKIYRENFRQGLQSDLWQEMPWGQDPRILFVPLLKLHHSGEISRVLLLQGRLPGLASEGEVLYKVSS